MNPEHYSESHTPLQTKLWIMTRTKTVRDSTSALPKTTARPHMMT